MNISEIARECSVERKTVSAYIDILEDLMLARRLPVFSKKATRRLVSHPKFYFFDVGVFRAIRPLGPLDSPEQSEGAAIETLVFQELQGTIDSLHMGYELFYWRTATGFEVDFVLYGSQGMIAIEVKRSSKFSPSDVKGLLAFKSEYPMAKLYLLYGGSYPLYQEEVTILPIHQALMDLTKILS